MQHRASKACVPCCSPLVNCAWGPQGHVAMEESRADARKQKWEPYEPWGTREWIPFGRLCIPRFLWPFWPMTSVPSCNSQAPVLVTPTSWACIYFPFVRALAPVFSGNGSMVPWGVWKCSFLMKLHKWHPYGMASSLLFSYNYNIISMIENHTLVTRSL